jgi:hypothetical protein
MFRWLLGLFRREEVTLQTKLIALHIAYATKKANTGGW